MGHSATEEEFGVEMSDTLSLKNIDDTPRQGLAMSARNEAASTAYDPSGAKPPNIDRTSQKAATRKVRAIKKKQFRSVQQEKTKGKQKETKSPEDAQRTMEPSDVVGGIERMRITLPPLHQVVPSSSLTLAPLRISTSSFPNSIPAKESESITSDKKKPTVQVTRKASIEMTDSIARAILSSPIHCMTTLQIWDWITENRPHHCNETGLRSAISNYLRRKPETFKIVGKFRAYNIWTVLPQVKASFT